MRERRRKKAAALWRDRSGNMTPLTVAVVLAVLMMICGAAEIARLSIIAGGIRDGLQQAVISVAVENYDELYSGLREGYSGGYQLIGSEWKETLDYDDVYDQMQVLLGIRKNGAYYVKEQEAGYEYRLSALKLELKHPPLAPQGEKENFKADAWVTIEIPLSFGWDLLPPLQMEIHTQAAYIPKF